MACLHEQDDGLHIRIFRRELSNPARGKIAGVGQVFDGVRQEIVHRCALGGESPRPSVGW